MADELDNQAGIEAKQIDPETIELTGSPSHLCNTAKRFIKGLLAGVEWRDIGERFNDYLLSEVSLEDPLYEQLVENPAEGRGSYEHRTYFPYQVTKNTIIFKHKDSPEAAELFAEQPSEIDGWMLIQNNPGVPYATYTRDAGPEIVRVDLEDQSWLLLKSKTDSSVLGQGDSIEELLDFQFV